MKPHFMITVAAVLTLAFLMLPVLVVIPMSFSSASSLSFPPQGFSLRWYQSFFSSDVWINAGITSALLASISSLTSLILGSLASYGLSRRQMRFRNSIESNFMAPMILPTIITAIALYIVYNRIGLQGTFLGLVLAHTMLIVPYVIVVMNVAFQSFDIRLEQVAWTMGASWSTTMVKVVLPILAPNLLAAWIFAFVSSFDEVVVTSFVAGTYDTIPKEMFGQLILEISPTITAVATLMIGITIVALGIVTVIMRGIRRDAAA